MTAEAGPIDAGPIDAEPIDAGPDSLGPDSLGPGRTGAGTPTGAGTGRREPAGEPRRRPVQQRSQERYERLVDACAALLDEVGATPLTTKAVAQRARVPIGTLYQFFSGKESLLAALAARNLDRYLDRLARRLGAGAPPGVAGFVDLAVEEFVAMKRTVPGFGQVDFGLVDRTPPGIRDGEHLLDTALDNNTTVALRLQALGGDLFAGPGTGGDRNAGPPDPGNAGPRDPEIAGPGAHGPGRPGFTLALRVALEAADAVLKLAFRTDPDGDPVLIAECKRLLHGYLTEIPSSPAGTASPASSAGPTDGRRAGDTPP